MLIRGASSNFILPSPLFNLTTPLVSCRTLPTHRSGPTSLKLRQSSLALHLLCEARGVRPVVLTSGLGPRANNRARASFGAGLTAPGPGDECLVTGWRPVKPPAMPEATPLLNSRG